MLSCSKTLAMLGAVNCKKKEGGNKNIASLLNDWEERDWSTKTCQNRASHLERHDAGVGTVLVDLIHGSLQSYSLLGEILQVLWALLGFLMCLTHLKRERKHLIVTSSKQMKLKVFPAVLQDSPGSCKWCNPPSRAVVQSGTRPCSHRPSRPNDGWKYNKVHTM